MNWGSLLGLVFIMAALVGVIGMMTRSTRPSPDTPSITRLGPLLNGFLCAAAFGSAMQGASGEWSTGIVSGAVVGALFAFIARMSASLQHAAIDACCFVFGLAGLVVTVNSYFHPELSCTKAEIGQRVLGFLAVAVALLAGGALSWWKGIFRPRRLGPTLLAVFGALGIVEFLSSPLGVSVVDLGLSGWSVALVAALTMGFAASIWPELVIGLGGAMIAIASIVGTTSGSANKLCMPGPDVSGLAPLVGFAALYFALPSIFHKVSRGRTRSKAST